MSLKPTYCLIAASSPHSNIVGPPFSNLPQPNLAIADTGSTAHFATITAPVINQRTTVTPITIRNPNGSVMTSTHEAELDLPMLPLAARRVHIVPALACPSLLSMGQFCDAGCTVHFTAEQVTVALADSILLTGHRDPTTKLWHLSLPTSTPTPPPSHTAHAAIGSATPADLVAFAHAVLEESTAALTISPYDEASPKEDSSTYCTTHWKYNTRQLH
jgi:hypothetical protein